MAIGQEASQVLNLGGNAPIDLSTPAKAATSQYAADQIVNTKLEGLQKANLAETAPITEGVNKTRDEQKVLLEKGAKRDPLPELPKLKPTDIQNNMGVLMALAAFSGMASRQPLTASLNAMAGLIQGVKAGDDTRFQRSYKEFDENLKKVLDNNRAYQHEFENVLKSKELSVSQQLEQIRLIDLKYQHQVSLAANQKGDIAGAVATYEKLKGLDQKAQFMRQWAARYKQMYDLRAKEIARRTERADTLKKEVAKVTMQRMAELAKLDTLKDRKPEELVKARDRIETNYRASMQALYETHGVNMPYYGGATPKVVAPPSSPPNDPLRIGINPPDIEPEGG